MMKEEGIMKKKTAAILTACFLLTGCGNKTTKTVQTETEGHYYSEEEAKAYLMKMNDYRFGDTLELVNEDGYFLYQAELAEEENPFITIGGTVTLEAEYNWQASEWMIRTEEDPVYTWHPEGSWYADTDGYEVYITFKGYEGNSVDLTAEAVFDKADGTGKGSYGEQDQTVLLMRKGTSVYDVYGECGVDGGYPSFRLKVEKDRIVIYNKFSGTETVMTEQ